MVVKRFKLSEIEMRQHQMSKFLPSLSILKKIENDRSSSISPFTTFYKEAPSAKLKILSQTNSPRRKYEPKWCKEATNPGKKVLAVSVTPLKVQALKVQKSIK